MIRTKPYTLIFCYIFKTKMTAIFRFSPRVVFGHNVNNKWKGSASDNTNKTSEWVGKEPHWNRWDRLPGETGHH